MKLIDANVILRYLLNDDPKMSEAAKIVIEEGAFTLPEVIAEVVYVLKGVYKISRSEVSNALIDFLSEIVVEEKTVLETALEHFGKTSLDFVDCILAALNWLLGDEVFTFDKKMIKKQKQI